MTRLWNPDRYLSAWRFAAWAHLGQTAPGSPLPYLTHIGGVAMEVMSAIAASPVDRPDLAVLCALLHDVLEDTQAAYSTLVSEFGKDVADGVSALTKNPSAGDKTRQMEDSLDRLLAQPVEVRLVKLADRIVNLGPPPAYWSREKIARYRLEARRIHERIGNAHPVLGPRLDQKIMEYRRFEME